MHIRCRVSIHVRCVCAFSQNNLASPTLCGPVASSVCSMCEREENSGALATEAAVASLSAALSGDAIDAVSSGFLLRASHRAFEKKSKGGGDLSPAALRMMITNTMKSLARHGAQESVATSGLHTLCGLTNTYKTQAIQVVVEIPDSLSTFSNLLGYHASAQPILCIRTLSIVREVRDGMFGTVVAGWAYCGVRHEAMCGSWDAGAR